MRYFYKVAKQEIESYSMMNKSDLGGELHSPYLSLRNFSLITDIS